MTKFKYFQSILNYRVPFSEEGIPGEPEVESKWTTERKTPKKKKSKDIPLFKPEETDEVYL